MIKRLKVTVDGKVYEVTVEVLDECADAPTLTAVTAHPPPAPLPAPAAAAAQPAPAARAARATTPAANSGDIRSPLAGKVVAISVKPGDQVTEGQQVMTLEAMKMNTYIYAPKAGRVVSVLAQPGDAVEEGATLITVA